jgi:hypothetical protein
MYKTITDDKWQAIERARVDDGKAQLAYSRGEINVDQLNAAGDRLIKARQDYQLYLNGRAYEK